MDEKEYLPGPLGVKYDGEFIPKEEIADLFIEFGGSFVQSLWESLRRADMNNTVKLLTAFENYVRDYLIRFHNRNDEEIEPERLVASAIKFNGNIVAGKRHGGAIFMAQRFHGLKRGQTYIQWFVTNYGRFVERSEALAFAKEHWQLNPNLKRSLLYSEDLW